MSPGPFADLLGMTDLVTFVGASISGITGLSSPQMLFIYSNNSCRLMLDQDFAALLEGVPLGRFSRLMI